MSLLTIAYATQHDTKKITHMLTLLSAPLLCACPPASLVSCTEEPLTLCALAGLAGPDTSVVLAGDPKQLGPVVHSKAAKDAGLGLSLLERLTSLPPYSAVVDGSSSSSNAAHGLIVKLVKNYRAHPALLQLPSKLFYCGELQACASPEITDSLLHWEGLPNKT